MQKYFFVVFMLQHRTSWTTALLLTHCPQPAKCHMTFRREQINFQVAPHVLGISLIFNTDQIVIDFPHTLQYTCSTYLATHDTHQKHQKGKRVSLFIAVCFSTLLDLQTWWGIYYQTTFIKCQSHKT